MLRVGCDLDGVLADLESALKVQAQRLWPERNHPTQVTAPARDESESTLTDEERAVTPPTLDLTHSEERALWKHVHGITNFWETVQEKETGAVRRLFESARSRQWEVMFLTSRPWTAGDTVQVQSQRWLARHGFEYPSVFVVKRSRGKIAAALGLDVVIDDRPENCLDVALESQARAILIWRGDPASLPASASSLSIGRCPSVHACLDILEQADSSSTGSGFVDLLKRLLGLKPASSATSR